VGRKRRKSQRNEDLTLLQRQHWLSAAFHVCLFFCEPPISDQYAAREENESEEAIIDENP